MLAPLLLALLAHSNQAAPAPRLEFVHAGFVRDARLAITTTERLVFRAQVDWPAAVTEREFVVEGLDAEGRVVASRRVKSCVEAQTSRHKGRRLVRFDAPLAGFDTAQTIRVRVAR